METTIITLKNTHVENDIQHMTSLEIAELTGKQHKNLMRDIRNMEPAWERTAGLKFELSTYKDSTGRLLPCYSLKGEKRMSTTVGMDITRVFFTTTESDLYYLDDEIFNVAALQCCSSQDAEITQKEPSLLCSYRN